MCHMAFENTQISPAPIPYKKKKGKTILTPIVLEYRYDYCLFQSNSLIQKSYNYVHEL
jgi:hypothetical protein